MGDMFYSILRGDEFATVTGKKLTIHFAARIEKGWGYRITHLPTGWLLVTPGFESLELARQFATEIETIYGSQLDSQNVRLLEQLAVTGSKLDKFHQLFTEINNQPKRTLSSSDLDEITRRIFNGQQAGKNS